MQPEDGVDLLSARSTTGELTTNTSRARADCAHDGVLAEGNTLHRLREGQIAMLRHPVVDLAHGIMIEANCARVLARLGTDTYPPVA